MEGTLRCTLGLQAQPSHSLEDHTRSIQHSTFTHTKHIHNIRQQNSNHTHCELFHQTIHKHCQTHKTNRYTNRATHKMKVHGAIKQSKTNNSHGPDKLNIRHLKLAFLTSMLKIAFNTNMIPHIWKLANIDPIPKPNKDIQGHLIQAHIPPLSNCKDTGEEPSSLHNSKHTKQTHAIRVQNTALYSYGTTCTHRKQHRSKGVQPNGSPCANNHCSTRYEQSCRHNKHTHTYQKAATDQHSRHNH